MDAQLLVDQAPVALPAPYWFIEFFKCLGFTLHAVPMNLWYAGLLVALVVAVALGHVSVTVDLPWDLSSTPHFIPDAAINRTQTITTPISISWPIAALATAGSVLISAVAALIVLAVPPAQPWSLLHGE